jgi:ABC-2 type transport system ATP-binding protein
VGIIAALLHQPEVVILDEPFNFLDPSSQSVMKHVLRDYHEATGATILVSSHNLNHTVDISSRIALLEDGRIIRNIDNSEGTAEKELEDYFNVD